METGCFGDVFDMLVKDDTKVTDVGGSKHSGAVGGEGKVLGGFDE